MAPIIVLILVQIGIIWLTLRQFGNSSLSVLIAILGVLNLCPWFTPYDTAEPFLLGQPWWLTLWMVLSLILLILLYIRLFRVKNLHDSADLEDLWNTVRTQRNCFNEHDDA